MSEDILTRQLKSIKRTVRDYFLVSLAFFLMAVVVFLVGFFENNKSHSNQIIFGAVPIVVCISAVFLIVFLKENTLLKQFKKANIAAVEERMLYCKKVKIVVHIESRLFASIQGVKLTDRNGQKYIYIYPEFQLTQTDKQLKKAKKQIEDELKNKTIEAMIYRDTKLIKEIKKYGNI